MVCPRCICASAMFEGFIVLYAALRCSVESASRTMLAGRASPLLARPQYMLIPIYTVSGLYSFSNRYPSCVTIRL